MDRRTLLLGLAALPLALAPQARAQGIDVSPINSYLLAFRTAQGRFRQVNPNRSTQDGSFYLSRRGGSASTTTRRRIPW